ncbi:MAG: capsule biosynthesis protein CapK [Planctomycetes bacterium]|nr:capsule biosynthesis protein CapK [Planctomycetota bacterium]
MRPAVPRDVRERTPLITASGAALRKRLLEHPDAPRWTYAAGDRLVRGDLEPLERLRASLRADRARWTGAPPATVLATIAAAMDRVPSLRRRLPTDADLERDWTWIPTCSRADLAAAAWDFVPDDADLDRLVIYRTAGTTGHPVATPHHPRAIAAYPALLEFAAERHGARLAPRPDAAGCFLVASRLRTYTYATVLTAWNAAGFAKLNLRAGEWKTPDSLGRYWSAFQPPLVTGDPVGFAELMEADVAARPQALVSTSTALLPTLRRRLEQHFHCPVVDWYSLVETGPVAYSCPRGPGFHVLPTDLFVEVLDPEGRPAPRGEIAVSGGRNPYLPLLRYRTGDRARLDPSPCPCGDPAPRLLDLEGRRTWLFRSRDGTPVTTADLGRVLREFPLLMHAFEQRADRSCTVRLRPLPRSPAPRVADVRAALKSVLGAVSLEVVVDRKMGDDGKVSAWRSAIMW